ncbi:hypothetical protein CYPRO_2050 [Cyclonatronum proteinivorum]|uniref:Transposase n=1 Tax=Cyclonatronum proteinivorum TaxID=1457365 RepID=A0A345ULE8_9BACT|nr:hypothetical protein [Cyclonatronum proteinivorum]AXI99511.1 hypothetical protein CYPRO_0224 [Cyclonatronum proteinivorum]AXJ00645.1 hypothetical protein CYPRO_1389 [Cyclonatronum proteinivorum]AXJ01300.1 hypothetical protein CYPRO_2050 [Cyclonatronum proteinivorum]
MATTKEQRMFALVDQWRASGELQANFCHRHQITTSTFSYWVTRKNKAEQQTNNSGFVQVEPAGPAPKAGQVELTYPNGVRLRVDGADVAFISKLIRVW